MEILNQKLIAGFNWTWLETIPGYPASIYELSFVLKSGGAGPFTIPATASGENYSISRKVLDTQSIPADTYTYYAILENGIDKILYEQGTVTILPNISLQGTDPREYWHRIYDNLKDAYEKLSSREAAEVQLPGGRSVKFADRAQLVKEINHAAVKAGIQKARKNIFARFIDV